MECSGYIKARAKMSQPQIRTKVKMTLYQHEVLGSYKIPRFPIKSILDIAGFFAVLLAY
jgi:hypothetical protein